ncbi:MAG: hypothetical protein Q8N81_08495 [bacterium]|nr:hypothetical protein [bacterium]
MGCTSDSIRQLPPEAVIFLNNASTSALRASADRHFSLPAACAAGEAKVDEKPLPDIIV